MSHELTTYTAMTSLPVVDDQRSQALFRLKDEFHDRVSNITQSAHILFVDGQAILISIGKLLDLSVVTDLGLDQSHCSHRVNVQKSRYLVNAKSVLSTSIHPAQHAFVARKICEIKERVEAIIATNPWTAPRRHTPPLSYSVQAGSTYPLNCVGYAMSTAPEKFFSDHSKQSHSRRICQLL